MAASSPGARRSGAPLLPTLGATPWRRAPRILLRHPAALLAVGSDPDAGTIRWQGRPADPLCVISTHDSALISPADRALTMTDGFPQGS